LVRDPWRAASWITDGHESHYAPHAQRPRCSRCPTATRRRKIRWRGAPADAARAISGVPCGCLVGLTYSRSGFRTSRRRHGARASTRWTRPHGACIQLPADAPAAPARKLHCATFSDCTTAPRNGLRVRLRFRRTLHRERPEARRWTPQTGGAPVSQPSCRAWRRLHARRLTASPRLLPYTPAGAVDWPRSSAM
jgi:hypothetical protein